MRRGAGFTLVEVLVAMAILLIGVVGIMRLNIASFLGAKKSWFISQEVFWAQSALEEAMSFPFDDLDDACESITSRIREVISEGGTRVNVGCSVIPHSERLKQILITVANSGGGIYTLSVYRSEGD